MLIDTGSTKSFLDPEIAFNTYKHCVKRDPFIVTSVFQNYSQEYSAELPAFEEFKDPKLELKFYLFKFHKTFDGLIGMDNIKLLQAMIDFRTSRLFTKMSTLPIQYYQTNKSHFYHIQLEPHTITRVKLPVKEDHGDVMLHRQSLQGAILKNTLSTANNNLAWAELINDSDECIQITLTDPVSTSTFNLEEFQLYSAEISPVPVSQERIDIENLIRTEHMNSEEKNAIEKICRKYSDIFHRPDTPLTFTNQVKHRIKTKDEIPVYTKSYRYPHVHKPEVEKQVASMLQQGIIRPSDSPWSSPIWVVPKKPDASGKIKWRIVVDYRKVNEKTIDDKYPLPNITDVLDKLGRCMYFTTLDLASGFHQIEMAAEDIPKTAFNVENGHFEYVRMPFGLKNAPATFQRVMDNVLKGLQGKICLVYMDDIIIYSTSLQEHLVNLTKVFQRLRDTNLKIQIDKSEFLKKEVAFLGHIITPKGIKPNPDKIQAILKYPIPKTPRQIKAFLGLLGYYRKFIKDFAKITKPLTSCLKRDAKIEHTPQFINCFEHCKNLLSNEPLLQYPDFDQPFNLTTDASNFAIGAVLSQGPIGKDRPVAYASRTLSESEQNYSTIEKEMLAIVWATKYFRPYLFGRKFKILSDHRPLQWLFSLKDPNSKLIRWRLKLEEYDYDIMYKKGKCNTNADALSRIEIHTKETFDIFDYMNDFNKQLENEENNDDNASLYNNPPDDRNDDFSEAAAPAQNSDEKSRRPSNETSATETADEIPDESPNDDETVHTNLEEPVFSIPISEKPLNYFNNQIKLNFVNHSPANPIVEQCFMNKKRYHVQIGLDNVEEDIIKFFKEYVRPKLKYAIVFDPENNYQITCDILQKTFKNTAYNLVKCNHILEDVNSTERQQEILRNYHEGKTNHRGVNETEAQIRRRYYWPTLKSDIEEYIKLCDTCQANKYDRHPPKPKFMITPTPTKPLEIIHLDTFQASGQKFLTIIDAFSKYGQAYPIDGSNAVNILNALLIFITHHGIPQMMVSDNGTEFKNGLMQEFVDTHKIAIHYITPENPQSNGMIERFHSTIIEHLRVLKGKKKIFNVKEAMPYAILGYNHSVHSATKQRPIDVLNGHLDPADPFDIDINRTLVNNYTEQHREKTKAIYSELNQKAIELKERTIENRNKKRQVPITYKPNTKVYTRTTSKRNKLLPRFTATKVKSNNKVTVNLPNTSIHKKNIKHIPKTKKHKIDKDACLQMDPRRGPRSENKGPQGQSRDSSPKPGTSKDTN